MTARLFIWFLPGSRKHHTTVYDAPDGVDIRQVEYYMKCHKKGHVLGVFNRADIQLLYHERTWSPESLVMAIHPNAMMSWLRLAESSARVGDEGRFRMPPKWGRVYGSEDLMKWYIETWERMCETGAIKGRYNYARVESAMIVELRNLLESYLWRLQSKEKEKRTRHGKT